MPLRRRAWLTREGWYYGAVLAFIVGGAVLRSVNLLVVLAGMMIATLLFNWRLVMASLTGLIVRRKLPEQILAGDPLTVEIEVENSRWWMSSWLLTVEDWVEREQSTGDRRQGTGKRSRRPSWLSPDKLWRPHAVRGVTVIPHVPARGKGLGTYRITLHRRGRYRFGPLRVSTRFPLGLVRAQITLPEEDELIVSPCLGRLLPQWANLLEAELVGDQSRHPERGMLEGDYYGLRPWQTGDSLRWVHWRTTAKLGRPFVRQFERRRSQDVAIILDPWLPRSFQERDEGLAELAISLAATAATDIVRRGHSRLTFTIAANEPRCFHGTASAIFCQEILAQLADLKCDDGYTLSSALKETLEKAPHGARLIVISPRSAAVPSLAASTAELTIDPDELLWIDASSEELGRLYVLD
jgi:uncharacterized protein (DUF58 family)